MAIGHLYVHIPFCRSRCSYCDFTSEPIANHTRAGRVERYLAVLRTELTCRLNALSAPNPVCTIYLGGGTPSVLPVEMLAALARDLSALQEGVSLGAEFTVEANPGDVNASLLERLRSAGVTRLSIGIQSFSPKLRAVLGRRVKQSEIEAAFVALAAAGWLEWNLDLVFGIPGQTWREAAIDLETAVAAGPAHISLYDLSYKPSFRARVDKTLGTARLAAAAFAERHYAQAVAELEASGYRRYEVSNFAIPGHECRHNQAYWRGEDYVGIGAAAVSTIGGMRFTNPRSVEEYLAGCNPDVEVIDFRTRLWEKAMLGLRTSEGVDEEAVRPVLDGAARDRLITRGCLERCCGRLRLKPGFLNVSNAVISALLASPME